MSAPSIPPRNGEGDRAKRGGGVPAILKVPIKQVKRARSLRRTMSLPEVLLWQALRQRPDGLKFRRQFPGHRITTDFACLSRRLIVEVDGEGHGLGDQPRKDAARDWGSGELGFSTIRIPAREVLRDLDAVIAGIVALCRERGPLHHPADGPPPRSGEELR